MLIEFRTRNHRSILDEQAFTMAVKPSSVADDPRARVVPGSEDPLVTSAVIYGPNASGKSNLLSAIGFMKEAVLHSHRLWAPEEGVPRDPFAWGDGRAQQSMYEIEFVQHGVRYMYGFSTTDDYISEEWLFAWPFGRKQIWLEREQQSFKFGDHLRGEHKVIQEFTRPNSLFLSAAAQLGHEQLSVVYSWFLSIHTMNLKGERRSNRFSSYWYERALRSRAEGRRQRELFSENEESLLDAALGLLKAADLGIVDIRYDAEESEWTSSGRRSGGRFMLRHVGHGDNSWLPLEEESQGTQTLFRMAGPIMQTLWNGGLLVVDELESSLHPLLALHIIRKFSQSHVNSQLIFTTHDTNLLGTTLGAPVVRRDQVWFTEKNQSGSTVVYPLTDFRPRKSENLERGYLQGRYGAVPFLGDLDALDDSVSRSSSKELADEDGDVHS